MFYLHSLKEMKASLLTHDIESKQSNAIFTHSNNENLTKNLYLLGVKLIFQFNFGLSREIQNLCEF